MTDAIDPRLEWMIWGDITTQVDIDKRNQLAADLSRQLLPPDHVAVDRDDLSEMLDAMDYVSEYLQKKWHYDEIRERIHAALSANGSDVATSPEAAAECPECGGLWAHERTCKGAGKVAE
jgi:hypothetical protein